MIDECEHDWEYTGSGYETCRLCGAIREQDYDLDDGRDFTPPYEP